MVPSAAIANGCIGWSPLSGRPETIVVGWAVRRDGASLQGIADDPIVHLGIEPVLESAIPVPPVDRHPRRSRRSGY